MNLQLAAEALLSAQVGEVGMNKPLASFTTWKIGGPADLLIVPKDKERLAAALSILRRHNVPWMVIGRGSNLLIADKGVRGAVIKLGALLDYVRLEGEIAFVGGGYSLIKLSAVASRRGLSGLEFAGGIPGSVGGAVYMNAGAHGSDMSRIVQQVEVMLGSGELVIWKAEELGYRYRHSNLQVKKGIVTEAVLKLNQGDPKAIDQARAEFRARRLATQPLQLASCGSVFRNPPNHHAAKLIEEAGLKGLRVGGAQVSPLHANFIINTGRASAVDVVTLIEQIQAKVLEEYSIKLVPEVLMAGER
jgi:UDP-N-acetylmuramate dehydrogenase